MPDDGRVERPSSVPIAILMLGAALTLLMASIIHFGATIPLGAVTIDDPFRNAAIPEAIIAAVMTVGLLAFLARRPFSRWLALAATLFALAGVVLGLAIVLFGAARRPGDVVYHVSLLILLLITAGLLLSSAARRTA